ncbi:hypothetical protein FACS1894130_03290 [Spirochaetia bacterium]|nr:hypothetical protein FACS1894130_03290 [Spirochaetia bacterium]
MASKKEGLLSPPGIFIIYILGSWIVILGIRFLFPAAPVPLANFSTSWRLTLGILECIVLFPALAMSAMVIPFGFQTHPEEDFGRFSTNFLDRVKAPIITAIVGVVLYGILFFLALPVARNARSDMEFRGHLFLQSMEKAREQAKNGEWVEAAQFLSVCERIWPNSPDMDSLRQDIVREMDAYRFTHDDEVVPYEKKINRTAPDRRNPVNVGEALRFAEEALQDERYYDAHWLATLAGRLARQGSVEVADASRLASRAWNAIASLEPNSRERDSFNLYRLKKSGYEAMIAEDWILAYYIFKELNTLAPADPDVDNYLAKCQAGALEVAFFTDELDMILGDILTGAVFSIPRITAPGKNDGRMILRVGSLSTFADYAYGFDIELVIFNQDGQLINGLTAPYAKFLPKTLGSRPRVVLLLQAIDRDDRNLRWGPVWTDPDRAEMGAAEVILDLSYENFLLMSQVRRGIDNFLVPELFTAEKVLPPYGYIPQVFRAEIIRRIAEPVFLLPVLILAIIIGWRYRAFHRPRYLAIPMLVILPLVFNGLVHIYRAIINTLGIWVALTLNFTTAMFILTITVLVLFTLSLIMLASQRG